MKFRIPFIAKESFATYLNEAYDLKKGKGYSISSNGQYTTFNIKRDAIDKRQEGSLTRDFPQWCLNQLEVQSKQIKALSGRDLSGTLGQFDLVSPERRLASLEVTSVLIPGAEGDMTAMKDHAPVITTLRPGVMKVSGPEGDTDYVVTGGFAEISNRGISVLAERAVPKGDMTQEHLDEMMDEAQSMYGKAKEGFQNEPGPVDDAAKLLSDMVAMGDEIGLSAKQPNL